MATSDDRIAERVHLHLVSDATGETVSSVARACLAQFRNVQAVQHMWSLVRSSSQMERVIAGIRAHPGIVMATILDTSLRSRLQEACRELNVPCIPILDQVLVMLMAHLGTDILGEPGQQHTMDAEYFQRIDAIDFTMAHDDGQALDSMRDADVIVVGVSRTGKTPTCMYLAHRGFKAANVPLIPDLPLPDLLERSDLPPVVALTREPRSLSDIRRARLAQMHEREDQDYADLETVQAEIVAARRLFQRKGWPVIDVTRRSVEETAAAIIQILGGGEDV